MSTEQFDVDTALADENTPAGLRDWAKKVQGENKKLADELAAFRQSQRTSAISEALKTLGVNEKVATFYPRDAEASPDAVATWVKEYGEVFTPAKPAEGATTPAVTDQNPLALDLVTAMRAVQDATPVTGGTTPTLAERANEIDRLPMNTADDRAKLDAFNSELQELARAQQAAHIASYRR